MPYALTGSRMGDSPVGSAWSATMPPSATATPTSATSARAVITAAPYDGRRGGSSPVVRCAAPEAFVVHLAGHDRSEPRGQRHPPVRRERDRERSRRLPRRSRAGAVLAVLLAAVGGDPGGV